MIGQRRPQEQQLRQLEEIGVHGHGWRRHVERLRLRLRLRLQGRWHEHRHGIALLKILLRILVVVLAVIVTVLWEEAVEGPGSIGVADE